MQKINNKKIRKIKTMHILIYYNLPGCVLYLIIILFIINSQSKQILMFMV